MQISVVIPTLNEAAGIGSLVRFIRQNSNGCVREVIVVDAESSDGTREVAEEEGAIIVRCAIRSRAAQMNLGARQATAEVLYFVHADVQLLPSFTLDILHAIKEGADAGCYRYQFDSRKWMLKVNAWCTRFGALIFRGGDQTLFVTKHFFEKVNGFDEHYTIMEDYELIQRIWKMGTFKVIPKNITVSARKYDTNSWLRVQLANLAVFSMYRLGGSPDQMRRTYRQLLRAGR